MGNRSAVTYMGNEVEAPVLAAYAQYKGFPDELGTVLAKDLAKRSTDWRVWDETILKSVRSIFGDEVVLIPCNEHYDRVQSDIENYYRVSLKDDSIEIEYSRASPGDQPWYRSLLGLTPKPLFTGSPKEFLKFAKEWAAEAKAEEAERQDGAARTTNELAERLLL